MCLGSRCGKLRSYAFRMLKTSLRTICYVNNMFVHGFLQVHYVLEDYNATIKQSCILVTMPFKGARIKEAKENRISKRIKFSKSQAE